MESITLRSTNRQSPAVNLRAALLQGQAPDRGLYLPDRFPELAPDALRRFARLPYPRVAAEVLGLYCGGVLPQSDLEALCDEAYPFDVPLEPAGDNAWVMRLDRGPTASFKDFAARIMARLIGRFVREDGARLVILVATSGDTGSAVASAFRGLPGIEVVVLFPLGEVSDRQRRQMTTLGGNVRALGLGAKFDDCQAMVKRAFSDPALEGIPLSSANSINIGRLLPQSVYYVYAASRLADPARGIWFSVPSGNFGNMMGAVIARRMGVPIARIAAPVNANDEFPAFLASGEYRKIEPSRACLSNAMNVGHPSNLARLFDLYGGWIDETGRVLEAPDLDAMRRDLFSVAVDDERTRAVIAGAWTGRRLLLEPHGAVGYAGYLDAVVADPALAEIPAVIAETAHPAKFPDAVEAAVGFAPEPPPALAELDALPERYERMEPDYRVFADLLRREYGS